MKTILQQSDKDIFPENLLTPEPEVYKEVSRVKALVFDSENKLALVRVKNFHLPGGGVEEGESLEEALHREMKEEIGCEVSILQELGVSDEFRTKHGTHQVIHGFVCKVVGNKGSPTTILKDEEGIEVFWYDIDEVLSILEKQLHTLSFDAYHSCFNTRAHIAFIKEYKNNYL